MTEIAFFLAFFFTADAERSLTTYPKTALAPAIEEAKAKKLLVVVEFWTFRTEPSRSYSQKVLSSKTVLNWISEHAVPARVNVDFNQHFRKSFNVERVPAVLLLDTDLTLWGKIEGPREPKELVKKLESFREIRKGFLEAKKAVKDRPEDGEVLTKLVKGYIHQEKPELAEKHLLKLQEVYKREKKPRPARMALLIGRKYELQHKDTDAFRLLKKAAYWAAGRNKEVRASATIHLATLELRWQQPEKASEILKLLLNEYDHFPGRSQALFMLADIYVRKLNELEKGRKLLEELEADYADRFARAGESLLEYIELMQKDVLR